MNTTKQAISKSKVLGVFTRKNQKQYKHTNGQWFPVATTELVDAQVRFSEFQLFKSPVREEWVTLPTADTLIAYEGRHTRRTPLPAGTRVRRVLPGCADWAGVVAVILPV